MGLIGLVVVFALCGCLCVFCVNCGAFGAKFWAKIPFSVYGCCVCLIFFIVGAALVIVNTYSQDMLDYACGRKSGSQDTVSKDA